MVANDGWAASHCQGRKPPKAGAEGPPLQWFAAQPHSAPRIECVRMCHSQTCLTDRRSKAVSPQEKPYGSGCKESPCPRLFLCLHCRQQVVICSRCDRGQVYCGRVCASEVRHSRQREARRRYQASERGRQMHADRSRRYRARGRRVTDQGSTLVAPPDRQPEQARAAAMAVQPTISVAIGRLTACSRCGRSVSNMVRQSPVRRPHRGPISPYTGRSACRHRRIATDSRQR
jgi:hypothetical protein